MNKIICLLAIIAVSNSFLHPGFRPATINVNDARINKVIKTVENSLNIDDAQFYPIACNYF